MITRSAPGWQWILADLALILFLVTLAGLASAEESGAPSLSDKDPVTAPVQALYRPTPGAASFDVWLSEQPKDPRAQLTIYAMYNDADGAQVWQQVRKMSDDAKQLGFAPKVIMAPGQMEDVYASFAFDASPQPSFKTVN